MQVSGARAAAPGTDLTVTVSNLDLTSLGAPANTTLDASFGAETVSPRATARTMALAAPSARIAALAAPAATSVAVVDGSATVTVGVPADAVGTLQLRLTAQPTGTAVVVPVQVTAAGDGAGTPVGRGPGTERVRSGLGVRLAADDGRRHDVDGCGRARRARAAGARPRSPPTGHASR